MTPPLFVPDASVLAKWVLSDIEDEQDVAAALLLRNRFIKNEIRLLVPSLWYFEVGNLLSGKYPEKAERKLSALATLEMPVAQVDENWMKLTLSFTQRYKVSFYDASYHALARVNNGIFITADEKYVSRVGKQWILRLRDYRA